MMFGKFCVHNFRAVAIATAPFVAFPTKKDGTPSKLYEAIKTLQNGEFVLCHVNVAVKKDGELGVYLFAVNTSESLQAKQ